MSTVYVTGGLGFIGSRVVERLTANKVPTVCVDYRAKLKSFSESKLPILGRIMAGVSRCEDLMEPEDLIIRSNVREGSILCHLGAAVDTSKADDDLIAKNVDFLRYVLPNFERISFASSGAVYGTRKHPSNVYGLTKAIGERMISTSGKSAISLRFMNVYGEDEHHKGPMASMLFKIARAAATKTKEKIHSLDSRRDFVHVDDVVTAVISSLAQLESPVPTRVNKVYDVGTGRPISFGELIAAARYPDEDFSPADVIDIPKHLIGIYQEYTCAGGMVDSVRNVFDQPWCKVEPMLPYEGVRMVRDALQIR